MKQFSILDFRISIGGFALAALMAFHFSADLCDAQSQAPASQNPKSQTPEALATLVVFNNADPDSVNLASYYAEKRGIPFDHLIGLDCPLTEEISRKDYEATIAGPLRRILALRGWWTLEEARKPPRVLDSKIRFVALIRGVPLKIAPEPVKQGETHPGVSAVEAKDEASVDSELAALGFFSKKNGGSLSNPFYRSYTAALKINMPMLLLVCRLDAPDAQTVRRMIDDSIAAEKSGLWGFAYIDARGMKGGGLAEGDRWLLSIAASEQRAGMPVVLENTPALFPDSYPMGHAALYYGWYSENAAGPFASEDFRFVKGALACHIHSFSAMSIRDPHKYWVAPLLAHGAAAAMGNVYEPFLGLTPHLDVFDDRLRAGFTFAESAYMSELGVSWMTTFVGDPLYRPFKPAEEMGTNPTGQTREWLAYRDGALLWFDQGRAVGERKLVASGTELHSGIIFESLGLLQASVGDYPAAFHSFQQARKFYTDTGDIIRTMIHEIGFLKTMGKTTEALALARKGIKLYPQSSATGVLRALDAEMAPTPTPSPSPATKLK